MTVSSVLDAAGRRRSPAPCPAIGGFVFYFTEVPTEVLRSRGHVVTEARDERVKLLDEKVAQAPGVITR